MILNVFEFIIEIWQFNLLNLVSTGVIRIVKECLTKNQHLSKCLSVLCLLLRKYTASFSIKCDQNLADFN